MDFLIVLLTFAIQRVTHLVHQQRLPQWIQYYFSKIENFLNKRKVLKKSSAIKILVLILPIMVIFWIILVMIRLFFNDMILFLFNIIILWYCLGDSRFSHWKEKSEASVFIFAYSNIFAIIFWYVVLGSSGALLYYLIFALTQYGEKLTSKSTPWTNGALKLRGIMDWIPIRLLGFTFALVGHFFIATSSWIHHLKGGVMADQKLITQYGDHAIPTKPSSQEEKKKHALFLVERALWLWLVILGITSMIAWIG